MALVTRNHSIENPALSDESPALERQNDEAEAALRENLCPRDWLQPDFAGRYDLIILGAGPSGIAAARDAALLGAKVALIERDRVGGVSFNTGSVPSKAIARTGRLYADMRNAGKYGGQVPPSLPLDFRAAMERVVRIQSRLSRDISAGRLSEMGVHLYFGNARFSSPETVAVAGRALRFRKALIATGSRPTAPEIPGIAETRYLTNEDMFSLRTCPRRLLVIGGGPLGCEMAQAYRRFGSEVVIAQDDPMFLPNEERDAAQLLSDSLARDGVEIHLNATVVAVRSQGSDKIADLVTDGRKFSVAADELLVGIGRTPNVSGLDLEVAGVAYDSKAGIVVDESLRTQNPRIYAAGDVCVDHKYTQVAEASARLAVRNALFPGRKPLSALTIPWCTYTDPEIAHVGLYVREARERSIPVRTFTVLMSEVDRAVIDGEEDGFVKVHVLQGSDRILGATVVARHAGEMINAVSLAIAAGIGLKSFAKMMHAYPTQAEAFRMAAEAFDRTRVLPLIRRMAERWLR